MTPEEYLEAEAAHTFLIPPIDYYKLIHEYAQSINFEERKTKEKVELLGRLAALEKRVAELEARPYYPVLQPLMPSPLNPSYPPNYPWITYTLTDTTQIKPLSIISKALEDSFQ